MIPYKQISESGLLADSVDFSASQSDMKIVFDSLHHPWGKTGTDHGMGAPFSPSSSGDESTAWDPVRF